MKERITVRKLEDRRKGLTDWARVDAMTEEELEAAIANDPDADVPGADWTTAKLVTPQPKRSISLRIDPDVLAWFKQQGPGHLTRMNAVLRSYYKAHRDR